MNIIELYNVSVKLKDYKYNTLKNKYNENNSCYELYEMVYPFFNKEYAKGTKVPNWVEDECIILKKRISRFIDGRRLWRRNGRDLRNGRRQRRNGRSRN